MDEIEKLYNVLVDQGLFDKTLDEFKVKFEESAYVDRVYDAVVDQGLFDKTKEDFTEKYSAKKKSKKIKLHVFVNPIRNIYQNKINY